MFTFNRNYFILAVLLFIIEVLIALFVHDRIIRPYIGDFLVVILIYCFIKSFINLSVIATALFVLLLSFGIEFMQYFHFLKILHLENSQFAKIVLGNSFAWIDLVAYAAGIIAVLITERYIIQRNTDTNFKPM